jgi:hypothetical protein
MSDRQQLGRAENVYELSLSYDVPGASREVWTCFSVATWQPNTATQSGRICVRSSEELRSAPIW